VRATGWIGEGYEAAEDKVGAEVWVWVQCCVESDTAGEKCPKLLWIRLRILERMASK